MAWIPAPQDVAPGKVKVVRSGRRRIAVCNANGSYYALDDACSHDGGSLDQGELDGVEIECPRHGARFDVTTGKALCLPAVRPVRSYAVRVHDGRVEIEVP